MVPRRIIWSWNKMKVPAKVLYLEDDKDSRDLVAYTLDQAGINVISAQTTAEALTLASTVDVDLFLLDGLIPNGDSLMLCRELRTLYPLKPIVFYSGLAFKEDIQRGLAAGADAYLVKPYFGELADELLRIIHHENSNDQERVEFLNNEDASPTDQSVRIIDLPSSFRATNWIESIEIPKVLIPIAERTRRVIRAAREIF
jgi:DNA-binding response OmpR family regulator